MSPFCRSCLGVARPDELRCPLDQEFYLRRDCPRCAREVYPRELYCAGCGSSLATAPQTLILPESPGPLPRLASLALDTLGVVMVTVVQLWNVSLASTLPAGVVLAVVYRALARAQGRQSFGQAVFHLQTIDIEGKPAGVLHCLKLTLAEPPLLLWSLVRGKSALEELQALCETREVCLV